MSARELKDLIGLLTARPAPPDATVDMLRERMGKLAAFLPTPADARVEKVDAGGVPAEWVSAPGSNPGRTLLYLHGGGYAIGGPDSHRLLAYNLSRASGARALLIDYRLAPEHPFPAAVEDAVAAWRWLLANGVEAKHAAVAGDSAGGGLVVALLLALRERGVTQPAGGFCISPWIDMEASGDSMRTRAAADPMVKAEGLARYARWYLAGGDARNPLASPLHANLKGLPPLLVQVGSAETLLDDSIRLAELAQAADVPVTLEVAPNMVHVWHLFSPMLGESREAIAKAGRWLADRMAG